MFKFAFALGIAYEWVFGASVFSIQSFAYAALRAICATLLAWMILEAGRALFLGAMSLDDAPPPVRRGGNPR